MKHDMKDEVSGGPEAPSTSIAEVWGTDSMPRQCPGPLECVELCVEQEGLNLTVNVDADLKRNQNYPLLYTGADNDKVYKTNLFDLNGRSSVSLFLLRPPSTNPPTHTMQTVSTNLSQSPFQLQFTLVCTIILYFLGVLGGKNWMIIDAEGDNIRIRILKILEFNYSKYKVSFIKIGIGRQQPEIIEFETTEAVAEIRTAINPQVETIKLRIRVNLNMDL